MDADDRRGCPSDCCDKRKEGWCVCVGGEGGERESSLNSAKHQVIPTHSAFSTWLAYCDWMVTLSEAGFFCLGVCVRIVCVQCDVGTDCYSFCIV